MATLQESTLKFDELPAEILANIAEYTIFTDFAALSQTNRRLHEVCTFVQYATLNRWIDQATGTKQQKPFALDLIKDPPGKFLQWWVARIPDWNEGDLRVLNFAVQDAVHDRAPWLILSNHSLPTYLKFDEFYDRLCLDDDTCPASSALAAMCWAAKCMAWPKPDRSLEGIKETSSNAFGEYMRLAQYPGCKPNPPFHLHLFRTPSNMELHKVETTFPVLAHLSIQTWKQLLHTMPGNHSFLDDVDAPNLPVLFREAYRNLGVFAVELRSVHEEGRAKIPYPSPTTMSIPFSTFMDTSPPSSFSSPRAQRALLTAHLPGMTAPAFWESDGKDPETWTDSTAWSLAHIIMDHLTTRCMADDYKPHDLLTDIHFRINDPATLPPEHQAILAGRDALSFESHEDCPTISCCIDRKTGGVELEMTLPTETLDPANRSRKYMGLLTPFGIFASSLGELGGSDDTRWLWMWKSSWSSYTDPPSKHATDPSSSNGDTSSSDRNTQTEAPKPFKDNGMAFTELLAAPELVDDPVSMDLDPLDFDPDEIHGYEMFMSICEPDWSRLSN